MKVNVCGVVDEEVGVPDTTEGDADAAEPITVTKPIGLEFAALAGCKAFWTGKLAEVVRPVTYTVPLALAAIPPPESVASPVRRVE